MRQIMAKCFSSSTVHCLGQTQTTVPDAGIYIWLGKSHPIITSVSRLNTAREHSQALECNHLYSSVLEWCLELFWPETTSTFPKHSWEWLRIQHQPGPILNGRFGCSYPIAETGIFHGWRHWQAVPAGPRTRNWTLALLGLPGQSYPQLDTCHNCDWEHSVVDKNVPWCPNLTKHLQPWRIRAFSVPLRGNNVAKAGTKPYSLQASFKYFTLLQPQPHWVWFSFL